MLTPEDIQGIANDLSEIYSDVESECIASIVKHIVSGKNVTQASVWQMKKLNDVGALKRDLLKRVKASSRVALPQIEKLIEKALRKSVGVDVNGIRSGLKTSSGMTKDELFKSIVEGEEFKRILNSCIVSCKDAMNLTGTRAIQASLSAYTKAINKAYLQMASGNYTYAQAVRSAVSEIGKSGIKIVERKDATGTELVNKDYETFTTYESGRIYPLDSAIRRDLTTQINQSCGEMSLKDCESMDCNLVQTSWHVGARPEHEKWQGRIFSLTPNNPKYPYFYDDQLHGGTSYKKVDGLCGINCMHSFSAYHEGDPIDTEGKPTAEENAKAYKEQQTQRGYERSLRGLKRQQVALREGGMIDEARKVQSRINTVNGRYRDFLSETGRTRVSMLDSVTGYRPIKASE